MVKAVHKNARWQVVISVDRCAQRPRNACEIEERLEGRNEILRVNTSMGIFSIVERLQVGWLNLG